ncbi:DoxX family protein [Sphingobacterium litopenaei]|uniref:DoxX family protein n=1 Tax=Sphingobacterium litopenaei TaxID=2763500 RepID=A0ABR7YFL0_9SPHI|nr:DoxX family protein [Sphingobacterium litopenaei]MBD1430066.1 DoxX family protein [Sphingobacterium litopenaei]
MNLAQKRIPIPSRTTSSSRAHWIDYLRIALGVIILAKGISFINDRDAVQHLIEQTNFQLSIWGAVHYVVFTHLVGGLFIILGFQTRLACILLFPVLVGAVFFVNITNGFGFLNSEFWLSIFVMLLLIIFIIQGSGRFSLDNMMNKPGYQREI